MLGITARFWLQRLLDFPLNFNPRRISLLSEGIEQLTHLNLLNIINKIQQQCSIHVVFCLMLGGAFVNISLHHTLAYWRKIGVIDTNKGTMVVL